MTLTLCITKVGAQASLKESLKLNLRNECRSTIFYKLFLTPELVFNMTTATTPKEHGKYVIIVEKSHVKPRDKTSF